MLANTLLGLPALSSNIYRGRTRLWVEGLEVKAYIGMDYISRLTERVLREFQLYVAEVYGMKVNVDIVELPVVSDESEGVIPLVIVEGRIVSSGEPPSLSELVDEIFKSIEMKLAKTLMGFPVLEESLVESTLSP